MGAEKNKQEVRQHRCTAHTERVALVLGLICNKKLQLGLNFNTNDSLLYLYLSLFSS